jgi:hypothetical protein
MPDNSKIVDELVEELQHGMAMLSERQKGDLAHGEKDIAEWQARVVDLLQGLGYNDVVKFAQVAVTEAKYPLLAEPHTPDLEITYGLRERVVVLDAIIHEFDV